MTSSEKPRWQSTEREWAQRTESVGGQKLIGRSETDDTRPLSTPRIPRFISRTEWRAEDPSQMDSTHFWPEWGGIAIHYEGGGARDASPAHPRRGTASFR